VPGLEPQHHRVHDELQVFLGAPTGREVVDGRSQVVGVRDGLLEPGGGLGSLAVPGELDRPAGVVLGSPLRRLRRPTGRLELVGREVADGLEQPEAGPSVERGRWLDEVALDQVHEDLDDRSLQLPVPDGGDRVEVPAPAQHRQAGEQIPLLGREAVVAPRDRVPQGPVPGIGDPASGDVEGTLQLVEDAVGCQRAQPGRHDLEREREAVEHPDYPAQGVGVGGRHRETWIARAGPVEQQSDRRRRGDPSDVDVRRVRDVQRRNAVLLFAGDSERCAGGGQDPDPRGAAEQGLDGRADARQVLEVVQDEEEGSAFQEGDESLQRFGGREPYMGRDLPRDKGVVVDRGELHEDGGLAGPPFEALGDLLRQAGLACAAGTGERDQPGRCQ
jgi:hypothetical protein